MCVCVSMCVCVFVCVFASVCRVSGTTLFALYLCAAFLVIFCSKRSDAEKGTILHGSSRNVFPLEMREFVYTKEWHHVALQAKPLLGCLHIPESQDVVLGHVLEHLHIDIEREAHLQKCKRHIDLHVPHRDLCIQLCFSGITHNFCTKINQIS